MYRSYIGSPCGLLEICAGPDGITRVSPTDVQLPSEENEWTRACREELRAYFAGTLQSFTVPLDAEGTEFQKAVWQAMAQVPYGKTLSYGALAAGIGNPGAARAVGRAVGKNPILILQPCHRIVGADGSPTGFAAGLAWKQYLLALEQN